MWDILVARVEHWKLAAHAHDHGCNCGQMVQHDDDIPHSVRVELMEIAVQNRGVYIYLCHAYRRGRSDVQSVR